MSYSAQQSLENRYNERVTLSIPATRVEAFRKPLNAMRWGQAFYGYMDFHKVTHPANKAWCDRLYQADDATAKKMVESVTDHAN